MTEHIPLSDEISNKINHFAEQGNQFLNDGYPDKALSSWINGIELIPKPQNIYSETVWFLISIGDIYFSKNDFQTALSYLQDAIGNLSGEGAANPFALLRIGQCYLETGNDKKAHEYLLRAYMHEGDKIFEGECEKYFTYLKNHTDGIGGH